ncbi:MAG: PilZ domain-containing protein [Candidatus Aminicenantes bacterium]|nr:PilZ domain-containing protein [Candidatus Aminicenantes bacterium]
MKEIQEKKKTSQKIKKKKKLPKKIGTLPIVISNRRREWRFELPLEAIVEGRLPQGESFQEKTTIENISSGGAYFGLDAKVVIGSKLNLSLNLPEKLTEGRKMQLHLTGTAVRLEKAEKKDKKQGVAVKFSRNYRFVALEKEKT